MEKLVRDLIPRIITEDGGVPNVRIAAPDEMPALERDKVREETKELLDVVEKPDVVRDDLLKEAADAYESIEKLCKRYGITLEDILTAKRKRRDERGGFDEGIVLLSD